YKWDSAAQTPAFLGEPTVAGTPVLTMEETVGYEVGQSVETGTALCVTATVAAGSLSYHWYTCQADGSGELAIEGATQAVYTPETDVAGIYYYFVEVSNYDPLRDVSTVCVRSEMITVTVGYYITFFNDEAAINGTLPDTLGPVVPGDTTLLPDDKPTKAGRIFRGWSLTVDGVDTVPPGGAFVMPEDAVATVTLYAIWRNAVEFSITYDAGAEGAVKTQVTEDGEADPYSIIVYEEDKITMPEGGDYFTNAGYRFMGWQVTAGGTTAETLLQPGEVYEMPAANVTFTAVWSKLYALSYSAGVKGIGISGTPPEGGEYIQGERVVLSDSGDLAYTNYQFKTWLLIYTDEAGSQSITLSPGDAFEMPAADVTVTAQWVRYYRLSFHENMYTPSIDPPVITGDPPEAQWNTAGMVITLPGQGDMVAEGYLFLGWYDQDYDYTYKEGDRYTTQAGDVELLARWGEASTLTFQNDAALNGTGDPVSYQVAVGQSFTMPKCTYTAPVSDDADYYYVFTVWEDETGAYYNADSAYYPTGGDVVFTAKWIKTPRWAGDIATELSGTGTQSDPYLISSAAELAKLAQDVNHLDDLYDGYRNVYFLQTEDIDICGNQWTPIGRFVPSGGTSQPFLGYYDGNGKTINALPSQGPYPKAR
ncbi:MAG: InlB B-repeat-containing protein, partial [Klebsiella quasipneumoniae]|nr:InlB B-repeat-containing protein [Klebsiella quasipneumoniae]